MRSKYRVVLYKDLRENISSIEKYSFVDESKDPTLSNKIDEIVNEKEKEKIPFSIKFKRFKLYYLNNIFSKKLFISKKYIFYTIISLFLILILTFIILVLTGVII